MAYFMKAAEVWQLDVTSRALVLSSSHFGGVYAKELREFQRASQNMRFPIDEGLPGKTWAARRPLIWTDLNTDHFKRKELAEMAGLECGLSIPVFAGEFLLGVVVLFFAADDKVSGAVEVWHNRDYYDTELRLTDGYYGALEKFEFISRRLTIMRGRGLPGSSWHQKSPVIMSNLADSNSFLRARNATECGITAGLAIPFFYTNRDVQVVNILSTPNTPTAKRFEVWRPDESHRYLLFDDGYCAEETHLKSEYKGIAFDRGESAFGQVWLTGRPLVEKSDQQDEEGSVYIPYIIDGLLNAVIKFTF